MTEIEIDYRRPAEDRGDDKVILRTYLAYEPDIRKVFGAPIGIAGIACLKRVEDGSFDLTFSLDRGPADNKKRQRHVVKVDPFGRHANMWPIVKLAPNVWDLPMSILIEGQLHAFVTIVNAPNPAPWE
jgi:hypothetical protein